MPHEHRTDDAPLSFGQEQLWLADALIDAPGVLNDGACLRLRGPLRVDALRAAFAGLVRRHDALRTTVVVDGGEPWQHVSPAADLDFTVRAVHDPSTCARLAAEEAAAGFDLRHGPLLRVRLYRLADDDHVLLIVAHHLVSDGQSHAVLHREIAALYRGETLPPLTAQYADVARAQRARLTQERRETLRARWARYLDGAAGVLDLPTDQRHPMRRGGRGRSFEVPLGDVRSVRIAEAARACGTTPFTVLLTAYRILLTRHTGQRDVLIGTPVSARLRTEWEPVIGYLANLVPVRHDLSGDPTVRQALRREHAAVWSALAGAELPFAEIVRAAGVARRADRTPLVQATLSFTGAESAALELPGVTARAFDIEVGATQYDLMVAAADTGDGLALRWAFNDDVFAHATVRGLAGRLHTVLDGLLDAALADNGRTVDALAVLTPGESAGLARDAAGPAPTGPAADVDALVRAQARRRPNASAVRGDGGCRTYAQIDAGAGRVAAALDGRGLRSGARVAVLVRRDVDLPTMLLGVLRAGCAYVPIDPACPAVRVRAILAGSGAVLLLTDRTDIETETPIATPRDLLDSPRPTVAPADLAPAATAYILFTSGSSGRPKGVAVSRAALANLLRGIRDTVGIGEHDRMLAVTTVGFDVAALEIFAPLIAGATLVLATTAQAGDASALTALLADHSPTVLHATPATWKLLDAAGWTGDPRLTGMVGGDTVTAGLATHLRGRLGALWHCYGPTEATVMTLLHRVEAVDPDRPVPLGRPLPAVTAHVLDERLWPVPPGAHGELYLGGAAVADGYTGMPRATADRFVPDPFAVTPGARLYRTGDRVRRATDGALEFQGRADDQVKVRGFRIEPGEVEHALTALPEIRDAAVATARAPDGATMLVGFVVPAGPVAPEPSAVRRALAATLPAYLVPTTIVVRPSLPVTVNGKVDRAALSALADRPEARVPVEPPAEGFETEIAALWREVLDVEAPGATVDLFDLGAHSLLVARLAIRWEETFGVPVAVADLFAHTTVRAQARLLEERIGELLSTVDKTRLAEGFDAVTR